MKDEFSTFMSAVRRFGLILQPSAFILSIICLAAVLLHLYPLLYPMIMFDDFEIIAKSFTWRAAQSNLWVPANEHAMPLGRLSTWALLQLAPSATAIPRVVDLQGPLALLAGIVLLYVLVARELEHPFYGLVAAALFGISAVYHQAVTWFAAGFSILALDTILLALLAAQQWRQTAKWSYLVLCVVACALAPPWFASGILAGPICCLYLIGNRNRPRTALVLTPVLGTAAFLAISLPVTARTIMHLEHYGQKTAFEAFDVRVGARNTCRAVADNLIPATFGFYDVHFPIWAVIGILVFGAAFLAWWWRPAQQRGFLYAGLALIVLSYLLVYSARADWDDGGYNLSNAGWSRYHLLAQLGLVLVVCGVLPYWKNRFERDAAPGALSDRERWALGLLILFQLITQLPRALFTSPAYLPRQQEVLAQIDNMDERCRAHRISADIARAALGKLAIPWSGASDNGWDFLHGSPDPRPIAIEDAQQLLLQE
jgi:hypothetical protein